MEPGNQNLLNSPMVTIVRLWVYPSSGGLLTVIRRYFYPSWLLVGCCRVRREPVTLHKGVNGSMAELVIFCLCYWVLLRRM